MCDRNADSCVEAKQQKVDSYFNIAKGEKNFGKT